MNTVKMTFSKKPQDDKLDDGPKLSCVPPVKNTQLTCALTGGSMAPKQSSNPVMNSPEKESQAASVPVVVVTKCPCCSKIISKETVFMSPAENDSYYHSFVENSIPGILKYEPCSKHKKATLTLVQ